MTADQSPPARPDGDALPKSMEEVLCFVSDDSVAIDGLPLVAWVDDGGEWWAGLPQSYIRLSNFGWTVDRWQPLPVATSPAAEGVIAGPIEFDPEMLRRDALIREADSTPPKPAPDAVREALAPFAALLDTHSNGYESSPDDEVVRSVGTLGRDYAIITVGDLRRAKAAFAEPVPPADGAAIKSLCDEIERLRGVASDVRLLHAAGRFKEYDGEPWLTRAAKVNLQRNLIDEVRALSPPATGAADHPERELHGSSMPPDRVGAAEPVALNAESAKVAVNALFDWADQNYVKVEACCEGSNVTMANQLYEAAKALRDMFDGKFATPPVRGDREAIAQLAERIVDTCRECRLGKLQANTDYNLDNSRAQCIKFVADAILSISVQPGAVKQ